MLFRAQRYQQQPACFFAFTLVELLVVISIIALLLSILMPSLKRAREQANEVVCASQLKQWGVAFECYAAGNRGYWPHCDGLDREDFDPNNPDLIPPNAKPWTVANWHGWVDVLPRMLNRKPWRHYAQWEHPRESTFYQCPTARLPEGHRRYRRLLKLGYFSYAMNSCLELDEGTWRPPGGTDWPMPSFLNTSRIVCPQRVIVLFDQLLDPSRGYGGWTLYRDAGEHCGSYPISFSARHARSGSRLGGNVLLGDGHVDWRRTVWKEQWGDWNIGGQQGPPRDDPDWYPYPAPQTGGR
jgi:prepilin-type N-terminal cleavage/methylation domain-containing protein